MNPARARHERSKVPRNASDLPPGTAACVKARARSRPRAARWKPIPTRSSAATVKSRAPIPRNCLGRLTPPVSVCRSSDYSAWRPSCRSRSIANRKSSSTRTAMAFRSPRSISPSPRRYRASTSCVPVNRSKGKDRLPCFQVDQGRDRLRGHARSVTSEIHHFSRSCRLRTPV
jgi:hypothetical protein